MCTAYEIGKRGGSFPDWMRKDAVDHLLGMDEVRIIRPSKPPAPVIMPDGSLEIMTWGLMRPVQGKTKLLWKAVVNSRADKLKGRAWSKTFRERRCLVPARSFFEWTGPPKAKVPLRFEDPSEELLWIAGIWEEDKERGLCFSMITTEPNAFVEPVHDRLLKILRPEEFRPYLDGEIEEFGPAEVPLKYAATENFLKVKKPKDPPPQEELF